MKVTEYPFNLVENLFNKYPTGKCVSKLEDHVVLEVMYLKLPGKTTPNYYLLTIDVPGNVYNTTCLVPFNPKEFPNTLWTFLKPDGTPVNIVSRVTYFEEGNNTKIPYCMQDCLIGLDLC
jgi:hypothetical protein